MDIDLLFSDEYEAGLICSENLVKKAAGLLFSSQTGFMTLEYADMDFTELNIPVDNAFNAILDHNTQVHIGAVKNGKIAQAYQIPLMFLDDPYRGERLGKARQSAYPLVAFERFVKSTVNGQPLHRENLADEDTSGCVLGDAMPSSLQFAPHLAQKHAAELGPSTPKAAPANTPRFSGPGLGGGGGGGGTSYPRSGGHQNPRGTPPRERDDD